MNGAENYEQIYSMIKKSSENSDSGLTTGAKYASLETAEAVGEENGFDDSFAYDSADEAVQNDEITEQEDSFVPETEETSEEKPEA